MVFEMTRSFRQQPMLRLVEEREITPVVDSIRPRAEGDACLQQMKKSPQFGKFVLVTE